MFERSETDRHRINDPTRILAPRRLRCCVEPDSSLRSHAFLRLLREPQLAVTNRYDGVTNFETHERPDRSVECDAISRLAHRHDVARVAGIVFQFSTQLGDVRIDRATHDLRVVSPDVAQQLQSGDDLTAATEQRHKQLELLGTKAHRKAASIDTMRARPHLDVAEADAFA